MVKKPFPQPIKFSKLLGPSFIILALGLGSGEIILWPFLVSKYGLGIAWGALLGITFQYFMNMEIERYSLIKGESVFVGMNKKFKLAAYWFIISTFIGFGIPGIVAASAKIFSHLFNLSDHKFVAMSFLALIGIILSSGKTVYGMMEKITRTILIIGAPFILILTIFIVSSADWTALAKGLIGIGESIYQNPEGYLFLPLGIGLVTFLAAFAYSGAGGNLNLTQSIYIKEKGYGMGKYGGKITSILTGKVEELKLTGSRFEISKESLSVFNNWWRIINIEHFLIFWLGGIVSICLLSLLAYSTVFGIPNLPTGVEFIIRESSVISQRLSPIIGTLFLIIGGLMLFNTQLTVLDATSRIMAENTLLLKKTGNLSRIYYSFLWLQILFGIIIFLFKFGQPLLLLTISAILNAITMFVHIGLTLDLNIRDLEKEIRPSLFRIVMIVLAFLFFGYFTIRTIFST